MLVDDLVYNNDFDCNYEIRDAKSKKAAIN